MPLRPELQAIFDDLMKSHPDGLTLDELGEELFRKPVTHADIDELIGALEDAGVDLDAPATPATPAELMQVLTAVRAMTAETGKRPTPEEIAGRTGLTMRAVRRALLLGRSVGQ